MSVRVKVFFLHLSRSESNGALRERSESNQRVVGEQSDFQNQSHTDGGSKYCVLFSNI